MFQRCDALGDNIPPRVRPLFLVAYVGRIMDAANTRKKEALGASVMRRSTTSNLTTKFLGPPLPRQFDSEMAAVL
ncbi:MAG: hypothetical protein GXP37_15615 [Chloroflexi bacterium]|nr:hypothetical protein [Chloroflexota bacterium]